MIHALILHNMGDPSRWREAVADLELAFARYAPQVRCIVHDAAMPLPGYVRDHPFDLIVLNSTFLGAVFDPTTLAALRNRFGFIAAAPAYKVALPQDDYYCSEEIDRLLTDWKMDVVYTVCPDHWDVLYPAYLKSGGKLALGYTGYVSPRMRRLADATLPRARRRFDVVYRASEKPTFPNGLAIVKSQLGERFSAQFAHRAWLTDITTDDRRAITGAAWWRFLANSRTTLGSNSGSSVLIRNLKVAESIRSFQRLHPRACYSEVLEACVSAADRYLEFTMISPRALEAALLETTQLLVPGSYSGVITAGQHYWPLREDCTNRDEVTALIEDHALQSRLAAACKEAVWHTPALQVESLIEAITSDAAARVHGSIRRESITTLRARYQADVGLKKRLYYARAGLSNRVDDARVAVRNNTPGWLRNIYWRLRGVSPQ